jgi:hypothetical protein
LTQDEVRCPFVRTPGWHVVEVRLRARRWRNDPGEVRHQPEIHAEVAATRLLAALGYAADHVYMTLRVIAAAVPSIRS